MNAIAATPPTRVRARVLGFAFSLAAITYLDRICISAAAPYMMADLQSDRARDERGVQRVHAGVFAVRGALGMARRRQGAAPRADADRAVVVGLHHADRGRAGLSIAGRDPLPVRRGRGGRVSEHGAQLVALVPAPRARPRQRRHAARLARRRHDLGAAGTARDLAVGLARHRSCIFGLTGVVWAAAWRAWYRDRPEDHPVDLSGGSGVDPAGRPGVAPPHPDAVAGDVQIEKPLRHLRDVFRVRVRAVFLLHLAADVPDQGAGLLAAGRRRVCGAAVPARRPRGPRRRLAHRSPVARAMDCASAGAISAPCRS